MFQQVTGEREQERERETPFGAEMERIDSVAPPGQETLLIL